MGAGRREMRIGYWTYGYEQTPPEEALPRLAAIGYRGIELCTQPNCSTPIETLDDRRVAAIKRLLGEHRLQTAPVDAHWGLVAPTPAAWEARLARFRRSIEVAAALGAPIVELSAGAAPPGWERARAWDALLEGAGEVAALAEAHGITLELEAHVGTVVERPDEAVDRKSVV
jgi:sugar phosphate isomerase/epimerase